MSTVSEAPLTWFLDIQYGLPVLIVGGNLDEASGELLYAGVTAVLRQQHAALLIDVAAVSVSDAAAVAVFTDIMGHALRWPDVRVLVCAPSTVVTPLLSADVLDPRLLFTSVAEGRSAALASVPAVAEDMLPVSGAARRARDVVTYACLRWDEPELIGSATLVASELVTNAAVHAHTMMTMQVWLQLCHLHIAVFDGSAVHAVHRIPDQHIASGRGLHLVDAYSAAWGSTSLRTGKVVWSAIARQRA